MEPCLCYPYAWILTEHRAMLVPRLQRLLNSLDGWAMHLLKIYIVHELHSARAMLVQGILRVWISRIDVNVILSLLNSWLPELSVAWTLCSPLLWVAWTFCSPLLWVAWTLHCLICSSLSPRWGLTLLVLGILIWMVQTTDTYELLIQYKT